MSKKIQALKASREQIEDKCFKKRHSKTQSAFTCIRSLPFVMVLVLILRKSVKSLQNVLNEAMAWLNLAPVTASAYSQARHKLKHTAVIELNQEAVVETLYSDDDYQTVWGFRVLALTARSLSCPIARRCGRNSAPLPGHLETPGRASPCIGFGVV
ncbi:MAG: hypothetical protein ACXWE4_01540 [Methylobacter sp.]